MKHLEEARRNFPSNDAIEDIHLRITSLEREISQQSEKMAALQEKMDELVKLLREYKNKIASKKVSANLKLNKKSYEDAIDNLIEYRNNLKNFQMVQKDHLNAEMSRRQCIELMEEVLSDMDDIRDDISRIEFKIKYNVQRVTTLTEMLKEKDIQGLKDRISKILQRLEEIPNINENLINRKAHLTNDISRYNQNIIDSEHRISMYEIIKRSWLKLLEAEKGYSEKLKLDDNLERIRDYLKGQKEPDSFNKSIERFNKQYNDDRGMLTDYYIDYNIIDMDLGDIPQVDIQDREFYDQIANLRDNSSRIVLVSRLDGREASIFQQRDDIDLHIRQQEEMLSEEDKKIYKDIILNNIGRSISQKIYEADDWIRSMNKLMKESETSNGLRFHLEWKAERQDDGIDTNVIVNLLHADPDTLRENDMERIKRFFDYKVQRAREIAVASEDSSDGKRITFYDCIREMLDYRNWYRFRLQYEKTNMSKRELTDKTFMKFSGGEKAMAMYVPLFSAVYSKYQEGSKEAPYIITLDEAFAGVDEQNIRDMFKMVEQLNFNYIMNSQALWGDYDVVPSLNIYELLRPNNSSCVTVVTSHWNGSSREIIFNDIETGGIDD